MAERSDRLGRVARQTGFGLIVAGVFFSGMVETGPTAWLPYFIEEAVGTSRSFGAVGLLCFALTMVCGRLTVPALVRRWGVKWIFVGGGLLSAISVAMAALPWGIYSTVFWLTLLGLAVSGLFPTAVGYAGDRFPTANASLFAVINSSAILGSVAAPAAVGVVADYLGLRPALASLALAALAAMCAAYICRVPDIALLFSFFVPTLIHVYVFTGAFILHGTLRSPSFSGWLF